MSDVTAVVIFLYVCCMALIISNVWYRIGYRAGLRRGLAAAPDGRAPAPGGQRPCP